MVSQKIMNLLDNASNQTSKFRTKTWVEINDDSGGTYNGKKKIKLKTTMLKSGLCDQSDGYILVKGTITISDTPIADLAANKIVNYLCTI